MHARLQRERRRRVAQIAQANPLRARTLAHQGELTRHALAMVRAAELVGEHEIECRVPPLTGTQSFLTLPASTRAQHGNGLHIEAQRSSAALGPRCREHRHAANGGQRALRE